MCLAQFFRRLTSRELGFRTQFFRRLTSRELGSTLLFYTVPEVGHTQFSCRNEPCGLGSETVGSFACPRRGQKCRTPVPQLVVLRPASSVHCGTESVSKSAHPVSQSFQRSRPKNVFSQTSCWRRVRPNAQHQSSGVDVGSTPNECLRCLAI